MGEEMGGHEPPDNNVSVSENKDLNSFDFTNNYKITDKGPYFVYVEHINKNFGRLFPVKVGYFLLENNEFKHDIIDITSVGVSRVKVVFKNYSTANSLIQHEIITKNKLIAYIPSFFNHRKGVIRMVDTFFSEEFLFKNIECSNSKVTNVQRMKRRVVDKEGNSSLIDRQMIIVTFTGNSLPEKVRINLTYFAVDPYIQPVVQCLRCLKYGHIAKLCKSKTQLCHICGNEHDDKIVAKKTCSVSDSHCIYCKTNDHSSVSKKCPVYSHQSKIKKEMAYRNIAFKDAEKLVNNPSYAKIVTHNQFSILNNETNFPSLPNPTNSQSPPKLFIRKPKQTVPDRKRKQMSPPSSPPSSSKKIPIDKETKTVLPNPYREEYMAYKEKLISGILQYIENNLVNKNIGNLNKYDIQNNIRETVNNIMEVDIDQQSDAISISDNDSTY